MYVYVHMNIVTYVRVHVYVHRTATDRTRHFVCILVVSCTHTVCIYACIGSLLERSEPTAYDAPGKQCTSARGQMAALQLEDTRCWCDDHRRATQEQRELLHVLIRTQILR